MPTDKAGLAGYATDLAKRGAPVIRRRLFCSKSGAGP